MRQVLQRSRLRAGCVSAGLRILDLVSLSAVSSPRGGDFSVSAIAGVQLENAIAAAIRIEVFEIFITNNTSQFANMTIPR